MKNLIRRPLLIFIVLITYAVSELIWWGWLLVKSRPDRMGMILGEGAVFLFLLIVGAYQIQRSIQRVKNMRSQQKNFLLSVTHELKSPLASIKISLQTILKRELDPERRAGLLRNSLKDIERLDDLVENMLLATKIENRSYSFPKEDFVLSELVTRAADRLQIYTCGCSQIIKTAIQPEIKIYGDQFALASMINNLMENAIKYSDQCAEVKVELLKKNDKTVFRVADTGHGIPDEEKPKIFSKFYRIGNEDMRRTKGTGLGLFIVKQVADNHSATINVYDNKPRGTVFEITFN